MVARQEHPKPQFERGDWMNLNGIWSFEIDNARSGEHRGLQQTDAVLSGSIQVPFCPESQLSGIGHKDFMLGVWYQKKVTLSKEQCDKRTVLHFGAVDYECTVYVNGKKAGKHVGGFVSFQFDITALIQPGENVITVFAKDDTRDVLIPSGKQSMQFGSYGCYYTRTTGIWQTVWLEFMPKTCIEKICFDTDAQNGILVVTAQLNGQADLQIESFYEGRPMAKAQMKAAAGRVVLTLQMEQIHLWEVGKGRLYDLKLSFGEDRVSSYFGLRSIRMDGMKFLLNGKSVFQRLILDQGFYPDGIYTAPTDEALEKDIALSMDMGFNGARAHEKVFEERWLYHADKMGYLVWGEFPGWGLSHGDPLSIYSVLTPWLEQIDRDRNHPCIITWCILNETWNKFGRALHEDLLRQLYQTTKLVDPSRPCVDASGFFHVQTDIYDVHDYCQDPAEFKAHYDPLMAGQKLYEVFDAPGSTHPHYARRQAHGGQPVCVSEYGGIRWAAGEKTDASWGYGDDVCGEEDFKNRFKGLTDALLDNDRMFGFCYTQLTDVEQEQNGLYTYTREPKFDPAWVRSVVARKAAIED